MNHLYFILVLPRGSSTFGNARITLTYDFKHSKCLSTVTVSVEYVNYETN